LVIGQSIHAPMVTQSPTPLDGTYRDALLLVHWLVH